VHISQISNCFIAKIEDEFSVGQQIEAAVLRVDKMKKRVELSIRSVKESESVSPAECEAVTSRKENKETLSDVSIPKVGDILEGRITRIADYGAFVSAGGVKGLIHKSEIANKFVKSVC
jgi:small subunit ribosomal protein S1